jgi:glycosyltransferase involved in cell wall biosynthesis
MKSLTVVIPAYNEEENLEATVREVVAAASSFEAYELIIIDDSSRDRTGEIADLLAAQDTHVRVVHNNPNQGLGWNFRHGIELAKMQYVAMVPGDNAFDRATLSNLFRVVGTADIITGWTTNMEVRPVGRRIVSWCFTNGMNILFGLRMKYYNGPCVFRTQDALKARSSSDGFAYMAEMLVRLLTSGRTVKEVGLVLHERQAGRSSALRIRNIMSVFHAVGRLIWHVTILNRQDI